MNYWRMFYDRVWLKPPKMGFWHVDRAVIVPSWTMFFLTSYIMSRSKTAMVGIKLKCFTVQPERLWPSIFVHSNSNHGGLISLEYNRCLLPRGTAA